MPRTIRIRTALMAASLAAFSASAHAQQCPIAEALQASDADVRLYDTHVSTLSSPAMGGRLPASPGMELAKGYVQRVFEIAGLEPAFGSEGDASWRQPFDWNGQTAENVGGILRGRGNLANQYIVVGAHLDHLGMGEGSSRGTSGQLHPGADDNASGVAAVLLMADQLASSYAQSDEDHRSVLFLALSGEETGLQGATYYANNPIAPITTHTIMINIDMIGRIQEDRISVSGLGTAAGLERTLSPVFEASEMREQIESSMSARSDHYAFYEANVPVLFVTQTDQHDDYHTQNDVPWKINRTDGAETAAVMSEVVRTLSTVRSNLAFTRVQSASRGPSMGSMRVRFGIRPGTYVDGVSGAAVGGVTPDSPADYAGVKAGDVLVSWNGEAVGDVRAWMGQLMRHNPGDVVTIGVDRDGERIELRVTLQGRDGV